MHRIRHSVAALAATALGGAAFAATAGAAPVQRVFPYTGGPQAWQVPAGVTSATFTLRGASGGAAAGGTAAGGLGAELRATVPLTPGEILTITVGEQGITGASSPVFGGGGLPGAAPGLLAAGSGGGATDVRVGANAPFTARILVAAGGGGGGGTGNGSGAIGGAGGAAGANGIGGAAAGSWLGGGGGLADGAGGSAGTGNVGFGGVAGGAGAAGAGGLGGQQAGGAGGNGGGGGGGWIGGGGGGAGGSTDALIDGTGGGGGAGGVSYAVATASGVSTELAAQPGNGVAVISYEPLAAPVARTQPTVSGVVQVGRQLTCEHGMWSGAPTFAYAWLRDGAAIPGATGAQYTLAAADAGHRVACQVTATNAAGATVARTPAIGVPSYTGPVASTLPAVTGTAEIGGRVTCAPGTWTGAPTLAYQWLRNGVPIANQTGATYTPVRADAGQTLQCVVRATAAGQTTTAQSLAVGGPARLVILNTTALVSRSGAVTVKLGCFGATACRIDRITAVNGGRVIARGGRRVISGGATSRVQFRLGRRGLSRLGRIASSIPVRFRSLPEGGYGGNVRMTWVALRGAR